MIRKEATAGNKGKMSTLDSGIERRSIDESMLIRSDKKSKEGGGMNQSFYRLS